MWLSTQCLRRVRRRPPAPAWRRTPRRRPRWDSGARRGAPLLASGQELLLYSKLRRTGPLLCGDHSKGLLWLIRGETREAEGEADRGRVLRAWAGWMAVCGAERLATNAAAAGDGSDARRGRRAGNPRRGLGQPGLLRPWRRRDRDGAAGAACGLRRPPRVRPRPELLVAAAQGPRPPLGAHRRRTDREGAARARTQGSRSTSSSWATAAGAGESKAWSSSAVSSSWSLCWEAVRFRRWETSHR